MESFVQVPDEPESVHTLTPRFKILRTEYQHTWRFNLVEERIELIRYAMSVISSQPAQPALPEGPPNQEFANYAACSFELALALKDRYRHTGQLQDIDEVIYLLRRSFSALQTDPSLFTLLKVELGGALRSRSLHTGDLNDLQEAHRTHENLLLLSSRDCDHHLSVLYEMGATLYAYFTTYGSHDTIARCAKLLEEVLDIAPEDHLLLVESKRVLASAFFSHYRFGGGIYTLYAAFALFHDVLSLYPESHPERWRVYVGLTGCLGVLYERTGIHEHLTDALEHARLAFALLKSSNNPHQVHPAISLSAVLGTQFGRTGALGALHECIDVLRSCQTITHKERPRVIAQLATALGERYAVLGTMDELDEGITLQRQALSATPSGSPLRYAALGRLASLLDDRYLVNKNLNDLVEAIDLLRITLSLSQNTISRHLYSFQLVYSLNHYYEDHEDDEKLDEAINICETCLQDSDREAMHFKGQFLGIYAVSKRLRYNRSRDAADLHSALSLCRESLLYMPPGHTERYTSLLTLAAVLRLRFEHFCNSRDIEEALKVLDEALELLPTGHPERATAWFQSAQLSLVQAPPFFSIAAALQKAKQAVSHEGQSHQTRLTAAIATLELLEKYDSCIKHDPELKKALLDVYTLTVMLLPRVAYFGLDIMARLHALAQSSELGKNAAAHALTLSEPRIAVELLEQGRGVFWAQHLRLRTAFDALPQDIAVRLADMAHALERDSQSICRPAFVDDDDREVQEEDAARRRRLSEDFDTLISEARALPGFERFMLPETFQAVSLAALRGPVVVLLASPLICQAIVIERPGMVQQIQLPGVTVQHLRSLNGSAMGIATSRRRNIVQGRAALRIVEKSRKKLDDVLEDLWNRVIRPIIAKLNLKRAEGRARLRVTLCPTGIFSHLPLHAAGVYHRGITSQSECLSDYLVPSYTPSLGAVLNARKRWSESGVAQPVQTSNMLIVSVSQPRKWARLPFASMEAQVVRDALPEQVPLEVLSDFDQAGHPATAAPTLKAVIDMLPQSTLLHLACHGHQNGASPLNSGFVMQDGMLTMAKLMSLNLDKAFLAFLSACETAKGDRAQPDQAIHLAAAMFFAGFKSVVGTMWSMDDVDGPVVAKAVYSELYSSGKELWEPDAVPFALDTAVRELRAKGITASRWAPYVHLGI